jgi:hypothetical protein
MKISLGTNFNNQKLKINLVSEKPKNDQFSFKNSGQNTNLSTPNKNKISYKDNLIIDGGKEKEKVCLKDQNQNNYEMKLKINSGISKNKEISNFNGGASGIVAAKIKGIISMTSINTGQTTKQNSRKPSGEKDSKIKNQCSNSSGGGGVNLANKLFQTKAVCSTNVSLQVKERKNDLDPKCFINSTTIKNNALENSSTNCTN